jgi:hypothetical protein
LKSLKEMTIRLNELKAYSNEANHQRITLLNAKKAVANDLSSMVLVVDFGRFNQVSAGHVHLFTVYRFRAGKERGVVDESAWDVLVPSSKEIPVTQSSELVYFAFQQLSVLALILVF